MVIQEGKMSELDKYLVNENEVKLVKCYREVEVSEEVARIECWVVQEEVMIM